MNGKKKRMKLQRLVLGFVSASCRLALPALLLMVSHLEAKAGLQTRFGLVTIENLQPGLTYNTREIANLPMVVTNTGDQETSVHIEVRKPNPQSPALIESGYEVVPSTSWVRVSLEELEIGAGASEATDVLISIPDDDQYLGKKYQTDLQVETVSSKFVSLGLLCRLRFTVAKRRITKEELQQKEAAKLLAPIEFDLLPNKATIENLELGKEIDLSKTHQLALKISNPNDRDLVYALDVVSFRESQIQLPDGYQELPSNMVKLQERDVRVTKNSIRKVKLFLELPDEKKYEGKKFAFAVVCHPLGAPTQVNQLSRFFLVTKTLEK